jgi:hypothetical protein
MQQCDGTPRYNARDGMTIVGLGARMKLACSKGKGCKCKHWEGGEWVWFSGSFVDVQEEDGSTRKELAVNVKQVVSAEMTAGLGTHKDQLLTGIGFSPYRYCQPKQLSISNSTV